MKRYIFIALAVMMALWLLVLGVSASESDAGTVESSDVESASEGVFEAFEEVDETVDQSVAETSAAVDEIDTQAVIELINGVGNKYEAALKLAGICGISVEDAGKLVDNIVVFGDEYFEEKDSWQVIRNDIISNPDKWTVIAIAALGFLALMVFLIRSLIKNTLTQTNTKLKLADIADNEAATNNKLEALEEKSENLKNSIDEMKELLVGESSELKQENDELKEILGAVRDLLEAESATVDSLKANSETSLHVTEESALQILQLLNIAMDRKVPTVTKEARKLWYDDAVAKVKAKAGITDSGAGERSE